MSTSSLEGLRILVTGAASGIGESTCRLLSARGATVVAVDRDAEGAQRIAAELPRAEFAICDVADAELVDEVFGRVAASGGLDAVVHAAGVDDPEAKVAISEAIAAGGSADLITVLDDERWRRIMSVNLDGTFHVLRASCRAMKPRGSGAIVVLGSATALDTPAAYGHYAASKAAVHALCQSAAKEAAHWGLRINVVAPGPTKTRMLDRSPQVIRDQSAPRMRSAEPEEIAAIAAFLISGDSRSINGEVILANGGRTTR